LGCDPQAPFNVDRFESSIPAKSWPPGVMKMRIWKRPLDIFLMATCVVSTALILLSGENAFFRTALCEWTGFCLTWEKILYDLAVGYVVSYVFYLLVVRLPDFERRRRLKRSLERHYRGFRVACIEIFLLVANGSYSEDLPKTLLDQKKFREYFKEPVGNRQDRWDSFLNNLQDHYLRELIVNLEIFRDEITFVLNNVDIQDARPFEFLKGLSATIFAMRNTTLDYDDIKSFSCFLWGVFSGFDWVTGYPKSDVIKDMIHAI
jgi:hypothetical protein